MEPATLGTPLSFGLFIAFVLGMLALDLGVVRRGVGAPSPREAGVWSAVWISLALLFTAGLAVTQGVTPAVEFLTGYAVEKALSVDNVFVFVVIFAAFKIPVALQHRVLFWGIIGALLLRAVMIFGGLALLERFHALTYVFGAFLVFTGVKLLGAREAAADAPNSRLMGLVRRVVPSTPTLDGQRFFTRVDGRWLATPLFLALVLVELSDVVFAVDSIPAVLAVTRDPFLVFTSNIFAMLGLRSLFFFLAGAVDRFRYLKVGLAFILMFVGAKLALVDLLPVHPLVSLGVIVAILTTSVVASRGPSPLPVSE